MLEPEVAMRRAWRALVDCADPAGDFTVICTDIIDDLVKRYAEPHRHYHTATHVQWVIRHVDNLLAASEVDRVDKGAADVVDLDVVDRDVVDRDVVVAAALFHDAIYITRPTAEPALPGARLDMSSEAQSARLAVEQLSRLGWSESRLAQLAALIEATQTHVATTWAAAVLLDADLAVLGAAHAIYQSYVAAVRAEYEFVDDVHWRGGRGAVLRAFLARAQIFITPAMQREREQQARINLAEELAQLEIA